jgi:hypothetical protein
MLTKEEGKKLLQLTRKTVEGHFKNQKLILQETNFKQKQGVFVTIHTLKGELRGCIGFPYPKIPLGEAVQKAAICAAFEDPRFPPLTRKELDKVLFEISVLTPPQIIKASHPEEFLQKIFLGKDGLIVEDGIRSGLLLPQVAKEHNLGVEEFLQHTCRKAGLRPDIWMDKKIKIYKFQAQIFKEKKLSKH